MAIKSIYKTIYTNYLNGLKNVRSNLILGNVNAYIQDTGTWIQSIIWEILLGVSRSANMKVSEECGITTSNGN